MKSGPKILKVYVGADGSSPFLEWLGALKDETVRARVQVRLDRAEEGNLGDFKAIGSGVSELRLSFGSGIRIYFGQDGRNVILLLIGGDKRTQRRDIEKAMRYWADYLVRKKDE